MAVLGKRKKPDPSVSEENANEIFRRHFEAQFKPIAEPKGPAVTAQSDDGSSSSSSSSAEADGESGQGSDQESEWGGLSDDDEAGEEEDEGDATEAPVVEVVDHSASQPHKTVAMSKRELRAFMSSRPPDQTAPSKPSSASTSTTKPSTTLPEDAPSLLAQDLELRRLLAESHLLPSPSLSSSSATAAEPKPFASGRTRRKATDLRVQALGSRQSILAQDKMPMHMRKGIVAAAAGREAKRRREAKENGIVLEREAPPARKGRKRQRGGDVDRPGVGRMRGAELRVSERDVKRIEGTRDTFGRKGRR